MKEKGRAIAFGEIVFESISRHIRLAPAINHHHFFGPKSPCLSGGVDGGVAANDDSDPRPNRNRRQRIGVNLDDEKEGFDHFGKIFAGNSQSLAIAKSGADKNRIVLIEFAALQIATNLDSAAEF